MGSVRCWPCRSRLDESPPQNEGLIHVCVLASFRIVLIAVTSVESGQGGDPNMKWIDLCGAACIASLLPSGASAGLIFDQSIDLTFQARGSEGFTLNADDLALQAGASTITDIHWWGVYASSNTATEPDNFTIRIFKEGG